MQNDKNDTRKHNIEILDNLGYRHLGNTQVFKKNNSYILSPAVKKNTQGYYWFDVSKKNLERMNNKNFLMLARIVPDLFIFEKSETIRNLLSPNLMGNGARQNKWGINFNVNSPNDNSVDLISKEDGSEKITVELFKNKTDIIKRCKELKR